MTTTTPEPNLQEKESELGAMIIAIVVLLGIVFMGYNTYLNAENISNLTDKHYDMAGKVSGIEIKGDDIANQLMLSIENQYWIECNEAIAIAKSAGYNNYRKLIFINPGLNSVRLGSTDGSEIVINIETKVITTYQPL